MAQFDGPSIVLDSLILCLDPYQQRSYPGAGTTLYDLSKQGNNGTLNNGASVISDAVYLDGVNNPAHTITHTAITSTSLTYEVWANPDDLSNDGGSRTLNEDSNSAGSDRLFVNANGNPSLRLAGSNNEIGSNGDFAIGRWDCIVIQFDGSNYYYYLNGVYKTTLVNSQSLDWDRIGTNTDSAARWWGYIGAVKFWNKILSPEEILKNYQALRGRYQ